MGLYGELFVTVLAFPFVTWAWGIERFSDWIGFPVAFTLFVLACVYKLYTSTRPQYQVEGKHVFITGGSDGLGLEFGRLCILKGAKAVTLFSRSESKLMGAKQVFHQYKDRVFIVTGDVGNAAQVEAGLKKAREQNGPIDICFASAGNCIPKYFEDLTVEDYDNMYQVNFMGVVNTARSYLKKETQDEDRKFVCISSIGAAVPFVGYGAYSPMKVAARAFCDVLRNEFADVPKTNIHICFPPDMDTAGFKAENETKPTETKTVWGAFNQVFDPKDVAEYTLRGIQNQNYHITGPDTFGNFLVGRGWGHHPRTYIMVEAAIAPIFVILQEIMVKVCDFSVRMGAHHSENDKKKA